MEDRPIYDESRLRLNRVGRMVLYSTTIGCGMSVLDAIGTFLVDYLPQQDVFVRGFTALITVASLLLG